MRKMTKKTLSRTESTDREVLTEAVQWQRRQLEALRGSDSQNCSEKYHKHKRYVRSTLDRQREKVKDTNKESEEEEKKEEKEEET